MGMENIEHVVVLVLENRSFDSLLGYLYENDETPELNIPDAAPGDRFRGMPADPGAFVNHAQVGGQSFSASPTRGVSGVSMPQVDPGEEYEHVLEQFYAKPSPGPTDSVGPDAALRRPGRAPEHRLHRPDADPGLAAGQRGVAHDLDRRSVHQERPVDRGARRRRVTRRGRSGGVAETALADGRGG